MLGARRILYRLGTPGLLCLQIRGLQHIRFDHIALEISYFAGIGARPHRARSRLWIKPYTNPRPSNCNTDSHGDTNAYPGPGHRSES